MTILVFMSTTAQGNFSEIEKLNVPREMLNFTTNSLCVSANAEEND